jgi:hypothetical protein
MMMAVMMPDEGDHKNARETLPAMMTMTVRHSRPEEMQEEPTKQVMHRSRLADTILQ